MKYGSCRCLFSFFLDYFGWNFFLSFLFHVVVYIKVKSRIFGSWLEFNFDYLVVRFGHIVRSFANNNKKLCVLSRKQMRTYESDSVLSQSNIQFLLSFTLHVHFVYWPNNLVHSLDEFRPTKKRSEDCLVIWRFFCDSSFIFIPGTNKTENINCIHTIYCTYIGKIWCEFDGMNLKKEKPYIEWLVLERKTTNRNEIQWILCM